MIKCVYATKIGDSILQDEDGSPIFIYPNTFYKKGAKGWWMLKRIETWWVIIRVLDKPKHEQNELISRLTIFEFKGS